MRIKLFGFFEISMVGRDRNYLEVREYFFGFFYLKFARFWGGPGKYLFPAVFPLLKNAFEVGTIQRYIKILENYLGVSEYFLNFGVF